MMPCHTWMWLHPHPSPASCRVVDDDIILSPPILERSIFRIGPTEPTRPDRMAAVRENDLTLQSSLNPNYVKKVREGERDEGNNLNEKKKGMEKRGNIRVAAVQWTGSWWKRKKKILVASEAEAGQSRAGMLCHFPMILVCVVMSVAEGRERERRERILINHDLTVDDFSLGWTILRLRINRKRMEEPTSLF